MKFATTISEQINLLKSRGLSISNEDKATEILGDIGYYRIGFYWFPFEEVYPNWRNRTHKFIEGASFETALALYYFDQDLRHILIPYLQRVEIHLRTTLIYIASNHYKKNPTWFADSLLIAEKFISKLPKIYSEINEQNKVIQRHHSKYRNDIFAPAWKTLEYMTFGNILYLIDSLKNIALKNKIIESLGYTNYGVFSSHMNTLRILRNKCAHGHNLFDLKLNTPIKFGPINSLNSQNKSNIDGAIKVLEHVLGNISINRSLDLRRKIQAVTDSDNIKNIAHIVRHISGV